jgi:hypothetical protein
LQQCSITAPAYRKLLDCHGIEIVELDNVFQGIGVDFAPLGLRGSMYLPYGYVATGRVCMIGSLHLTKEKKFATDGACQRECHDYVTELDYGASPHEANSERKFFQKGNTVFYVHSDRMLSWARLFAAGQGISRIVYQPTLPMG